MHDFYPPINGTTLHIPLNSQIAILNVTPHIPPPPHPCASQLSQCSALETLALDLPPTWPIVTGVGKGCTSE